MSWQKKYAQQVGEVVITGSFGDAWCMCVIMMMVKWPLLTWGDNEGDHARPVAPGQLQRLDQLLHLPDLDILVCVLGCLTHSYFSLE